MGPVLIHAVDRGDEAEWRAFLAAHRFGELVAGGRGREVPVVAPTQFAIDGDTVLVHLARVNVWDAIEEQPKVLLAVSGDWTFVPSSWKAIADEDPRRGIPTTYYASVQLSGPVTLVDDPDDLATLLRTQLGTFQPDESVVDPLEHGAKLRMIRGLRLAIEDVRAKFKYGGNVDSAHRRAVAERLARRDGPGDAIAREHLVRRLADEGVR
jgi:transcriptional regulator